MPQDTLYIIAAPGEMPRLSSPNVFPAWLSYRLSPDMELLRLDRSHPVQGGVMVLTGRPEEPHGNPDRLCAALLRECAAHQFQGLLLDFDHPVPVLDQLARNLARLLPRLGVTLFLPEWLAGHIRTGRVLIPSALSGGSLEDRLQEAVEKYGAERVVLAVERCSEDFTLPSPDGCGVPLSQSELNERFSRYRPHPHFSRPLCARYFTYCVGDSVHLVLFDDADTLAEKMACARRVGVHRFLLPWQDISAAPERFLPSPQTTEIF